MLCSQTYDLVVLKKKKKRLKGTKVTVAVMHSFPQPLRNVLIG